MYNYDVKKPQRRNHMDYTKETCKSCGKEFAEGDDIVVCPVCATPHHRECWKENNRCVNEELHAEGYVWSKAKKSKAQPEAQPAEAAAESQDYDSAVCHICGSENPKDALHCGSCGALLAQPESKEDVTCTFCGRKNPANAFSCSECGAPLTLSAATDDNPFLDSTGFAPDDMIGSTKADNLARYVQSSSRRYLPKFKKLADGKKTAFNWAAFFLAPYWFFYRKLYKAGIFFAVLFVSVSLLTYGVQDKLLTATEEYYTAIESIQVSDSQVPAQDDIEKARQASNEFFRKAAPCEAILIGISIIERLICALTANRFYYKKATDDIQTIYKSTDSVAFRKLMTMRRGGVSLIALFTCFLGMEVLMQLLVYIANQFM